MIKTPNASHAALSGRRIVSLAQIVGIAGVTLFVATEAVASAAAGVWAFSGLLGLNTVGTTIVGLILGLPTLYLIGRVLVLAYEAETDPENN